MRGGWQAVVAAIVAVVWLPAGAGAGAEKVSRFALHPVGRLTAPPVIDGTVDKREWYGASMLPSLIDARSGLAAETPTRVYIGHSDKELFIAFQIARPEKARVPSEGDEIVVAIDAAHAHKAPAMFRANVTAAIEPSGNWQYKARTTDDGWEGELAIALAALGRAAPADGEIWGFDFRNQQRTPVEQTSGYSFGNELSHIVFVRDLPALRFLGSGAFHGEAGSGAILEIPNSSDRAVEGVNVRMRVLRRRPDAAGSFLPNVAPVDTPDIIVPTAIGIDEELAKYDAVPNAETNTVIALPANRRAELRVVATQPAEYLLDYRIARGEQTIGAGLLPYRLMPSMQMSLRPYFLGLQIIEAIVDLRKAKDWSDGAVAKFSLMRNFGEAPLATAEQRFAGQSEFAVTLPIDKAEPGGYVVTMELIGADGKSRGSVSDGFHKPPTPAWLTDRAGLAPLIPPPWKPIEAKDRSVSFLTGEYELGESPLPRQMNVRSVYEERRAPMLASPMALTGKVNGKPIAWSKATPNIQESRPALAKYSAKSAFENLSVTTTTEFEYDGMAKVTLKLTPAAGTTPAIDHLAIEIPLTSEFAQLYLHGPVASEFWMKTGFLPDNRGAGALPKEGLRHQLVASVWLGNEERGFTWFAENNKGWALGEKFRDQAIEIEPAAAATTLRVNLFKDDQPFVLKAEREIVFAFMFTPSRLPRSTPIFHGLVHDRMPQTAGTSMTNGETWILPMQGWPSLPHAELLELAKRHAAGERIFTCEWRIMTLEEMQQAVAAGHDVGMTVTPYLAWGVSTFSQEYQVYGEEIINDPLTGIGCNAVAGCWNTPLQDVYTALLRDRIVDLDIDGFRTDAGFIAAPCNNVHHTGYGSECGWIDEQGKLQSSRNLFAARRMTQRAYRLFHGGGKDNGVCIKHIHNATRYDALLGHTDSVMSAEGAEMKANSLKEFPLEFYRATVMGDSHGWQVSYMAKAERVGADARLGICLLHNLNPRGGHEILKGLSMSYCRSSTLATATPVWAARKWIGPYEKGTELWGYWKNAKYLDTGDVDVKGTLYVRRGEKMLLGLLNLDRRAVQTVVRIDLAAFGFKGKVHAYDPMLREELPIENGAMNVTFTPEGFRMIQLSATPFDLFVPEKVGPNLVEDLASGIEGWRSGQYIDERHPQPATTDDLRFENGSIVIQGKGDNFVGLARTFNDTEPGKTYMFEADLRIDADDAAFLGEKVDVSYFWISCGETTNYNHDIRVYGGHFAPGHTEKVRLYFTRASNPVMVDFRMIRSKGKATLRNISLHEIESAPPWCKRGTP